MKIFVTGASGFIGFAVASALSRAGHQVVGLVRSAEKAKRLAAAEIEPVAGDMVAPARWRAAAKQCSAAVHCAAEMSKRFLDLDRGTVRALLDAAKASGLPRVFVYTSGVWVLGDTGDGVADEAMAPNPPRLVAKRLETEKVVLAANAGSVKTLVIRPGCVYGGSGSLTGAWFSGAEKDGAAPMVGDGTNRWALVHLDDLSDLYVRAVESGLGGEVFHATDRSRATVRECAEAASRAAGARGKVVAVPLAEAAKAYGGMAECLAMSQHVDSSKAVRLLHWQPRHGGFADRTATYFASWKASQGA